MARASRRSSRTVVVKVGLARKTPRSTSTYVSFEDRRTGQDRARVMEAALKAGMEIESIDVHMPSLEDVFIHYTGTSIREEKAAGERDDGEEAITWILNCPRYTPSGSGKSSVSRTPSRGW